MSEQTVTIVGGGFSGLAACVRLAEAGFKPVVLERRQTLGGRAFSFEDEKTGDTVDNGQHVLMQCCHETTDFLRLIGGKKVHFEDRFSIPFVDEMGSRHELYAPSWLPSTLGLLVAFLRFPPVSTRDALGLGRAASSFKRLPDKISVTAWLDRVNQSDRMRQAFWHPLCISVMNAPPDQAPAREFVAVLSKAFAQRGGSFMGWSTVGLSDLFAFQAQRYIERAGGIIHTATSVTTVKTTEDGIKLGLRDNTTTKSEAVILAAPPPRVRELTQELAPGLSKQLGDFTPSPILGINLWFDRQILDRPFLGFLGQTVEWAFSKSHVFENGTASDYVSLVISASSHLLSKTNSEIIELALEDLVKLGLIEEEESPQHARVIHEKQATYLRPYDSDPIPSTTEIPGLYLAGDWTDTGLPPTIEGAVRSGNRAADHVVDYLKTKKPRETLGETQQ